MASTINQMKTRTEKSMSSYRAQEKKEGALEPEPCTESEPYTYGESPAEPEPEPATEALEPDVYLETPTTPEAEALAIPKEPSDADPTGSVLAKEDAISTPDENCVQIRASSKHLTLASSYFKRNVGNGTLESHILSSQGHVEFRMDEKDP
ncbi:hypothetical protein MMC16_000135 [Acarospora aff. strigata]|nr:hypothetical protein [Acarospora aff. strigata]